MDLSLKSLVDWYRLAADTARMGLWEWDLNGDEVIWNEYQQILFGFESGSSKVKGRRFIERIHPDDRGKLAAARLEAMQKKTYFELEYRVVWPDGSTHWILTRGRPVFEKNGKALKLRGSAMDITERKLAEDILKKNLRILGATSKILERLQNRNHSARSSLLPAKEVVNPVRSALKSIWILERNIVDVLNLSKLKNKGIKLDTESVDLCRLTEEVVGELLNRAVDSGFNIKFDSCEAAVGKWDRDKIQEALTSILCSELRRAKRGTLQIFISKPKKKLVQVRIRGPESRTPGLVSGDLDLRVARAIAKAHGGDLRFANRADGRSFIISLPCL